ncbi:hypothetical protein [Nitrosomonas sp. ANs5]|uniref:hypothetical protein n=1 Tax=Nitrosomonas sp. ANs5 TaxID=3423941 RepID=UPI003D32713E
MADSVQHSAKQVNGYYWRLLPYCLPDEMDGIKAGLTLSWIGFTALTKTASVDEPTTHNPSWRGPTGRGHPAPPVPHHFSSAQQLAQAHHRIFIRAHPWLIQTTNGHE